VYYARADGSSIRRAISGLQHPNGIGLSPNGRRLYVAETWVARIWVWEIDEPGQVRAGSTFYGSGGGDLLYGFGGLQLLDSMAIDGEGNVCQAILLNGGIASISPAGELVDFLSIPDDPLVTNICFGGNDLQTAFITGSTKGVLYSVRWPRPGLARPS
jgi:gluconolactonase